MPQAPTINAFVEGQFSGITVEVDNPDSVDHNLIFRTEQSNPNWVVLGVADPNDSYTDYEAASGISYTYRAKAVSGEDESAYSNQLTRNVVFNKWWIRHLSNPALSIENPFIDNDPLEINTKEEQAKFRPLQRKYPIVIKDKGIKAAEFDLSIQFLGEEAFVEFEYLRSLQTTLLLQSPMSRQWYFVFDSEGRERIHNTQDAYRHMQVGLIEVERPHYEEVMIITDYYGGGGY